MVPAKSKIWVVEDESDVQFVYEETLSQRYQLRLLSNLKELGAAMDEPGNNGPDLLIADLRLAGESFLQILTQADQRSRIRCPLMVVSSIDEVDTIERCFENGAKDYLTKPFGQSELLVKIERLLNTQAKSKDDIVLDPVTLTVEFRGLKSSPLTAKEFQVVAYLLECPDRCATRKEMHEKLWAGQTVGERVLEIHLSRARRKIISLGLTIRQLDRRERFQLVDLSQNLNNRVNS